MTRVSRVRTNSPGGENHGNSYLIPVARRMTHSPVLDSIYTGSLWPSTILILRDGRVFPFRACTSKVDVFAVQAPELPSLPGSGRPLDKSPVGARIVFVGSINAKVIQELRALEDAGAPGLLVELIDLFLAEADKHIRTLKDAFNERNASLFEKSAHTLKGSSGNLGAMALSKMCSELQDVGHAADWVRASTLLPGLESEFGGVKKELESEKKKAVG